jgi:hypothetical protein
MAAGLTDHPWTMGELLRYQVPPAQSPSVRGRGMITLKGGATLPVRLGSLPA